MDPPDKSATGCATGSTAVAVTNANLLAQLGDLRLQRLHRRLRRLQLSLGGRRKGRGLVGLGLALCRGVLGLRRTVKELLVGCLVLGDGVVEGGNLEGGQGGSD